MNISYHITLIIITILLINFRFSIAKYFHIFDFPDKYRKLHEQPTPAIGGIILIINFLPSFFFFTFYYSFKIKFFFVWLFLLTFFFLLGYLDDRIQLKPLIKTFLILSILLLFLPLDNALQFNNLIFQDLEYVITLKQSALYFTVLSIFLLFNAVNFSDGLNGICVSQNIFWLLLIIYFTGQNFFINNLIICLSIILIYNILGKIFLGNSGTSFLSILISLYFIKIYNENLIKFDEIILIFFLPVIDAIRIVIERIINNKSPFAGDNNHFHHLLSKIINKKFVFIPYIGLSIIPFILSESNLLETYYIFIFGIIIYLSLIIIFKKIKNV